MKPNKKYEWSKNDAPTPVKLESLVCKDCFHRSPRTDICAAYPDIKPFVVLCGNDCKEYEKK